MPPALDADYFDSWYAAMPSSPRKDEIQQRHLGLPPHLLSTSLLPWEGIADVAAALALSPSDTLLDLACGRGGYGLEMATRMGCRLIGIDFSPEAVRQAADNARSLDREADFRVGELAATGLADRAVQGIVCVDAIQFADDPTAAYAELHRVLAAGGRVVLTCWEPVERDDERVPDRLRAVDLHAGLTAAGFADVAVLERTDWRAAECSMWQEAAALDPQGDPALQSFHDEGRRAMDLIDRVRRVMATAAAPA